MMIRPILFNTDMVRAILDCRKTVTRRIIKGFIPKDAIWGYSVFTPKGYISCRGTFEVGYGEKFFKLPCQTGDIMYVRETWSTKQSNACIGSTGSCPFDSCETAPGPCFDDEYIYKATDRLDSSVRKWHPSINMPKEAARIWLKVTDVRVEQLQDIKNVYNEGIHFCDCPAGYTWKDTTDMHNCYTDPVGAMEALWDSTIPKGQQDLYSWGANPWVWVIEFERCEKPETAGEENRNGKNDKK